jgi:hypothetical protein
MKVLTEGHRYELANFEKKDEPGQIIQFIQKEPYNEGSFEMKTVQDGTTNEEVIEMLIDRLQSQHKKMPSKETACCITHLEEGLMWLNKRTSDRMKRGVEGKMVK